MADTAMTINFPFFKRAAANETPIKGSVIRSAKVLPRDANYVRMLPARKLRMYDAAVFDNLTADFPATITSANAEIFTSISTARARARKLTRDNPYARAIISTFRNNVGGHDPFRLDMKLGTYDSNGKFVEEKNTNRMIEAAWKKAGRPENCTVRQDMSRQELYLQVIAAVIRDGGIMARHHALFPNNPFRYAIEPLEIDLLDQNYMRPAKGTDNEIQFSIEMNSPWHAPVAYWILTRHPGDIYAYSNTPKYRERVPVQDMIALWDLRDRAGQYIGMTRFTSFIKRLWREEQFDIAHCSAAIKAAATPIYLTKEFPTAGEYVSDHVRSTIDAALEDEQQGEKYDDIEPGVMREVPYGYKVNNVDPKFPIENAEGFKKGNLRGVGSGSMIPYHILANDLGEANFSSARIGGIEFQEECKVLQQHVITNYCVPHFESWLPMAIMSGEIKVPISRLEEIKAAASFLGKRWPYLQPLQDAQAAQLKITTGLSTRDIEIKESDEGCSAEEIDAGNAADKESAESHGVEYPGMNPNGKAESDNEDVTKDKKYP